MPNPATARTNGFPTRLVVYGASNDRINVSGDIRVEDTSPLEKSVTLTFHCGTVLKIYYGDRGIWAIDTVVEGDAKLRHYHIGDYNGDVDVPQHSEVVTLVGRQAWMAVDGELVDFCESPNGHDYYNPGRL